MSNHRWCCCGEATDCCDMQNCSTFVAPTKIKFEYIGSIVRQWSSGQNCTLHTLTYTVESEGPFFAYGNNCDGEFGIPQRRFFSENAKVSYTKEEYFWQPKDIQAWCEDASCGQTNDPAFVDCTACTQASNFCECRPLDANFFGLYRKVTCTGAPRIIAGMTSPIGGESPSGCCIPIPPVGATQAVSLSCCVSCGCARPTISFTPAGPSPPFCTGTILSGSDTCTDTYYQFCGNTASTTTTAADFFMPSMVFSGKCGCPAADTWNELYWDQGNCPWCASASFGGPLVVFGEGCAPVLTCDGLFNGVCNSGKMSNLDGFGFCLYYEECGGTLSAVDCSWTLSFQDVVTQQLIVTIT